MGKGGRGSKWEGGGQVKIYPLAKKSFSHAEGACSFRAGGGIVLHCLEGGCKMFRICDFPIW